MNDSLFSTIYENAPVAMAIVDEDVKIQSANRSALELIDKPLDDALGIRAGAVFGCLNRFDSTDGCGRAHMCKSCKIRSSVNLTMSTGQAQRRVEASIPIAVGDRQVELSLLVSTAKISWDGRPLVLLCLENITDLKAAQRALRRSNEHMKVLNSIMRHDIRGNLAIVSASIELAKERAANGLDDESRGRLDKAITVIQKSADLLDHMRELENTVSAELSLKPMDLGTVIDSAKEKSDLDFAVRGRGSVLADDALESALDNIVRNAAEHGKAKTMTIEISEDHGWTVLRMADDGKGIPDDVKSRVFDKGFTTGGRDNQGLGLYIAKSVIEQYGGRIRVEDSKPTGTAFVIELRKPGRTESLGSF